MDNFDKKYNIINEKIPPNSLMVARYKQSFAFYTLKERLPVILTQVLDNLSRDKELIAEEYSEAAREELKEIVGNISKLKYELQTDKEICEITSNEPDTEVWNEFIRSLNPGSNTYFSTCWLYAECYMYRKLHTFFESSKTLKNFDYFQKQKQNALTCCTDALEVVINKTRTLLENDQREEFFKKLLKLNLWGNRCDLSISEGKEIIQTGDQFCEIDALEKFILVDNTDDVWNCVSENFDGERIIDIINDNSGYELFTDFIIAEFLIDYKLATKIRFYVKACPWYISDVTTQDFKWTLEYLRKHESKFLSNVGEKWSNYVQQGKFELSEVYHFWTSPYEFNRMKEVNADLYKKLSQAHLVMFKGDLNYRKLIGDFTWNYTENFATCLRGFHPSNVCTLRTVKADLICGLKEGIAESLDKIDSNWMTTGQYGVIQFCNKKIS